MDTHEKFLEFNGNNIVFINQGNNYYIALKPICEALGIDYIRAYKNAKSDPILGDLLSDQTVQVTKNGKKQGRKLICIPERYVYGWIFSLKSDSSELISYKKTCYDILFAHFHGIILNRKELLLERSETAEQIAKLEEELKEQSSFVKLQNLKLKNKNLNSQLGTMDKEMIKQPELFSNN